MSNVFTSIPEDKIELNTNVFDWSHSFNMSTEIGKITPVFCEKLPEHSSLSLEPAFAFQLMPLVFPIQTDIVARLSFYKIPLRALWKNYQDWVSSVNQSTHGNYIPPYVNFSDDWTEDEFLKVFGTRSLADFFDMPTTYDGSQAGSSFVSVAEFSSTHSYVTEILTEGDSFVPSDLQKIFPIDGVDTSECATLHKLDFRVSAGTFTFSTGELVVIFTINTADSNPATYVTLSGVRAKLLQVSVDGNSRTVVSSFPMGIPNSSKDNTTGTMTLSINSPTAIDLPIAGYEYYVEVNGYYFQGMDNGYTYVMQASDGTADVEIIGNNPDAPNVYNKAACPWFNVSSNQGLKVSAYPWRAYDAVYNTFVRYIRNNPLYDIRNQTLPLYNKVTQLYDLPDGIPDFTFGDRETSAFATKDQMLEYATPRYANWEFDQFTTAVQSPQEGVAPLVGLSVYSTSSIDEDGVVTQQLQQYVTDEDGKRFLVNMKTSEDGVEDITYTEVQNVQGRPVTSLYSAITQGISIADFRNVNAYTAYLERNQRHGYRYKDIIEGRYDVKIRFDELLMPEFIGGLTRVVRVNPVTQTVQTVESGTTYDGALGSKAGDGYLFAETNNNISTFLDEKSIVIGLLSFTPKPVYTQTIKKWLLDRDILDEWAPEFNALGFQPILNSEVAPIQYYNNERENLNGTFGYQRPWYHLTAKYDTAHGDFRGPLRNFLMHRVFSGAPKLTREFLQVNPAQVNDVFNVSERTDKIFGQVGFNCKVKLGVSRNAVPRLEV